MAPPDATKVNNSSRAERVGELQAGRRNSRGTKGEGHGLFCNSCLNKLSVTITNESTSLTTKLVHVGSSVTQQTKKMSFLSRVELNTVDNQITVTVTVHGHGHGHSHGPRSRIMY